MMECVVGEDKSRSLDEIQVHMGCPLRLLNIISKINEVARQKRAIRQSDLKCIEVEGLMYTQLMQIRSQLETLQQVSYHPATAHLQDTARCFYIATDLFLRLASDVPCDQPQFQARLTELLEC
ncbi:hypothetical protein V1506DRAFT_509258 [Lipomyces tetrasporus]